MNSPEHNLVKAAVEYAERGWPVLPLHSATDRKCTCRLGAQCTKGIAKHPRTVNGLKDATTSADQIREWWRRWPDANVGILTGIIARLAALDVDNKPTVNGDAALASLVQRYGPLPTTRTSITGMGRQLFFVYPAQPIRNSASKIGEGLDIRGEGGYVVAPPSLHATGRHYRWDNPSAVIADMPEWLLRLIASQSPTPLPTAFPALPNENDAIDEGRRNSSLITEAGLLRWAGLDRLEIEGLLRIYNELLCDPPLEYDEISGIAQRIAQKPPGRSNPDIYWFKFRCEEWFARRNHRLMQDYQRGWLINLLTEAWARGGTLPTDLDRLAILAGADSREQFRDECWIVLEEFEHHDLSSGTILVHPRFAKEFLETVSKCFTNKINGRKGGRTNNDRRVQHRRESEWPSEK